VIKVNDKTMEWSKELSVFDLLKKMGYKLNIPPVLFRVNNEIIRRESWNEYCIPDKAEISIVNLLRGG